MKPNNDPPPPPNPNPNLINNADITPTRIQAIKDYQATLQGQTPQQRDQFRSRKLGYLIQYHFGENIDWQQAGRRLGVNFINDGDDIYRVGVALILFYSDLQRGGMTRIRARQNWVQCQCCRRLRNMTFIYLSRHRLIQDREFKMGSICVNLMIAVIRNISYAQASDLIKQQQLAIINQINTATRYQRIIQYLDSLLQTQQMNQQQMSEIFKSWLIILKNMRQFYDQHRNDNQFQWYDQLNLEQLVMFNNIMNYFQNYFMIDRREFRFKLRDHDQRDRKDFQQPQLSQLRQFLHGKTKILAQLLPGQQTLAYRGFMTIPRRQVMQPLPPPAHHQNIIERNKNKDNNQLTTLQDSIINGGQQQLENQDQFENQQQNRALPNRKSISKQVIKNKSNKNNSNIDRSRSRSRSNNHRENSRSRQKQLSFKQSIQRSSLQKQRRKQLKQQQQKYKKKELKKIQQVQSQMSSEHADNQQQPIQYETINLHGMQRISSEPLQNRAIHAAITNTNSRPIQQQPVSVTTPQQIVNNSNNQNEKVATSNSVSHQTRSNIKKEPKTAEKQDKDETENEGDKNN